MSIVYLLIIESSWRQKKTSAHFIQRQSEKEGKTTRKMIEARDADRGNETAEVTKNWRGDGEEEASNRSVKIRAVRRRKVLNERWKWHVRGKVWPVLVLIFNSINTWFKCFTVWCWWSSLLPRFRWSYLAHFQLEKSTSYAFNMSLKSSQRFRNDFMKLIFISSHSTLFLRGRVTCVLYSSVFRQEGAVWSCASYSGLVYMLKPLWYLREFYRISMD